MFSHDKPEDAGCCLLGTIMLLQSRSYCPTQSGRSRFHSAKFVFVHDRTWANIPHPHDSLCINKLGERDAEGVKTLSRTITHSSCTAPDDALGAWQRLLLHTLGQKWRQLRNLCIYCSVVQAPKACRASAALVLACMHLEMIDYPSTAPMLSLA